MKFWELKYIAEIAKLVGSGQTPVHLVGNHCSFLGSYYILEICKSEMNTNGLK